MKPGDAGKRRRSLPEDQDEFRDRDLPPSIYILEDDTRLFHFCTEGPFVGPTE